jgi:ABC-type nickel/cobalt efflux system permease component RcnA
MTRPRHHHWLIVLVAAAALGVWPRPAAAHPVPKRDHLRSIDVQLRPDELCIHFVLEVDEWTVVFVDLPSLLDDAELRTLTKPSQFYDAYTRRLAPLLADQLIAMLDDAPLTLHCVEQRYEVLDHLRCEFIFQANWAPSPRTEHRLAFHDHTYEREPGRVRLALAADESINVIRRTVPGSALQSRPPTDLRPGDDDRLRTIQATFRVDRAEADRGAAEPPAAKPPTVGRQRSSLVDLLDAPHGVGVLLLLAALFGAAHALTPGHGKTMVAAYLVGERGTVWHALTLGLVTTLTHTGGVLAVAAGLTWWFPDAAPAKVEAALRFVGGLLVAGVGVWLLLRRLAGQVDHLHLGADHRHNPDGTVTYIDRSGWWRVIQLGVGGGIVPCWDAVLLLGFAIATQRLALALPLLLAFSAGLAAVLVAIGVGVVYAHGAGGARWSESRLWRALPIVSAAVLIVLGLWLCRDGLTPPAG